VNVILRYFAVTAVNVRRKQHIVYVVSFQDAVQMNVVLQQQQG